MATHGSSSEDDGDDGDDGDSSSDEEVESMVAEYVKKIFKYVKKVNMYGYNVHLREGRHHQHIKFTKIGVRAHVVLLLHVRHQTRARLAFQERSRRGGAVGELRCLAPTPAKGAASRRSGGAVDHDISVFGYFIYRPARSHPIRRP
jgi:hypothetical protein